MIRKIRVKIYNSLGLFLVFFTISLLFSIVVSAIISYKQVLESNNSFFSKDYMSISLQVPKEVKKEEVFKVIENEKGIILGADYNFEENGKTKLQVKGLYFNDECYNVPPKITGRFLNNRDFQDNQPVAVVGKNFKDKLLNINGEKYLLYKNNKYKVIGLIGYKDKTSFYDNWAVINLKYCLFQDRNFYDSLLSTYKIDNLNGNVEESLSSLGKGYKELNKNIDLNISANMVDQSNELLVAVNSLKWLIDIFVILVVVLFINIINTSFFWVQRKRKEIAIRKALGATDMEIFLSIVFGFEAITITASIIALLVQVMLKYYIKHFSILENINQNNEVYSKTLICLIIFSMILGLFSSFIPTRYILKLEPNDIIRER